MTEKRKLTLKDIAKELGISVSTASRALKSHPDIAQETIRAVKEYAEKHRYVPNYLAVNFRKNRTFNIGLIVPELVHHFFSSIISGAIDAAKEKGYNILVSQSNELLEDEKQACRTMLGSSVDGLLISISNETRDGIHLQEILEEGIPIVQFDKYTDTVHSPVVIVDDLHGAYLAVKHLIEEGYKKIAHIRGRVDVQNSQQRAAGYYKALTESGLETDESWVHKCQAFSEEEGYQFAELLMRLPNPPDAIFCVTDLVALGVLKYLKESGIRVPQDVGVIGFSNWKHAEIVDLSSVDQHGYEMGVKSVELLVNLIELHDTKNTEIVELKTNLVLRDSTAFKKYNRLTIQ